MNDNKPKIRLELVDALRGFALFGILMLHSIEHFDFVINAEKNPEIFKPIDPLINEIIRFLFSGKSYSIFSLMFGFSFFIQMERGASRGVDFRGRFFWRLVILLVIGYVFSLIYIGEILSIYAIMGMPLILMFKLNKKALFWIAILLILQIPTIYNIINSYINPDFEFQRTFGRGLYREAKEIFANGSFLDVIKFSAWKGHLAVWGWTYYNGRYLQLFGLFLLGLFLGKANFFENVQNYKKQITIVLISSLVVFVVLYIWVMKLPGIEMPRPRLTLYRTLLMSYKDIVFTSVLVCSITLLHMHGKMSKAFKSLASYGRMSLTNYVFQPIIGVPFFYGFGLGMFVYFGHTLSLFYGIIFFVIQLYLCKKWLKHFHYGPLEWLWRALTFFDFKIKFRKTSQGI